MCERASSEYGTKFLDLDHDAPIEFARLKRNENQLVPQPYIAMRVRYSSGQTGLLFYAQMAITELDPIEIQQIRHRFPSFPDEPTTNQFYTPEQVDAYRDLGYHIGSRLCGQLEHWTNSDLTKVGPSMVGTGQPMFDELTRRLKRGYVQACYEELYYKENDVYGESIWRTRTMPKIASYPTFESAWERTKHAWEEAKDAEAGPELDEQQALRRSADLAARWLTEFSSNADVSCWYLEAVNYDINPLSVGTKDGTRDGTDFACNSIAQALGAEADPNFLGTQLANKQRRHYLTAHFVLIAVAAQQLHRGTPHAIFQVGGRDKLIQVIASLIHDICKLKPEKKLPKAVSEKVIHEVFELSDCVFQSADLLTVVTFVQCLCRHFSSHCHVKARANRNAGGNPPQQFAFRLSLDFRQLLFDALQSGYRSRTERLIAAYLRHLQSPLDPQFDVFHSDIPIALSRNLVNSQRTVES